MTTELTKAAQQALEALDEIHAGKRHPQLALAVAHNLRRALAQRPAAQTAKPDLSGHDAFDVLSGSDQSRASLPAPQQATPAQEPHPLAAHCYTMSESHLSGYRLILGFETMEAVNTAQTWVANINKGTQQATPEPVGEPAAWQERQTEYVSGTFGRWYNCTGPSPRAAMEDGHLSLTTGGITYQWRPLYTRPAAAPAVPEWQPMETAPKDGTHILAFDGRSATVAFWGRSGHPMNRLAWIGGHCRIDHIDQPTHWMPLPPAPLAAAQAKGGE